MIFHFSGIGEHALTNVERQQFPLQGGKLWNRESDSRIHTDQWPQAKFVFFSPEEEKQWIGTATMETTQVIYVAKQTQERALQQPASTRTTT